MLELGLVQFTSPFNIVLHMNTTSLTISCRAIITRATNCQWTEKGGILESYFCITAFLWNPFMEMSNLIRDLDLKIMRKFDRWWILKNAFEECKYLYLQQMVCNKGGKVCIFINNCAIKTEHVAEYLNQDEIWAKILFTYQTIVKMTFCLLHHRMVCNEPATPS